MCHEMELLMQADHDGELDAAGSARVSAHLAGCAGCAAKAAAIARLSAALRAQADMPALPPLLAARAARLARPGLRSLVGGRVASAMVGMALAASLILVVRPQMALGPDQANEIVTAHIRALQPGHLMDVISTDRHTVKPWFNGRLDYAPPVRDFASSGFPLRGARLDVLGGTTDGVLVFARASHMIDLAVWPGPAAASDVSIRGFNVISWSQGGMAFVAVSDLNAGELEQFRNLWRRSDSPPTTP
jgi:anti-sigma factor RsiW